MKNTISICDDLEIDIPLLLKTRLLVQANSGGGKSWLIRRIAEQAFGKVPVIIIDPEGEFATLREKFGYVLVGKGGETPADLRSATLVAHKLLELRASAVCDLYEMKPQARHQWVRAFLDAMIDSPKQWWGPAVVIVDEAHQFCPEGKAGESEASSAMVDLATRGRKRGFCAVFATQRLGKLRKDAAAELMNVMIGNTFIDIDRERAAECLGISREEKHEFHDQIKMLGEGNFYCLGRAIARERVLIKVGPVQTTHPEAGGSKFSASPPPAPKAIEAMLPKLADLPKAAEEKARTESDLRKEVASLKRELQQAQREQPARVETKEVPVLSTEHRNLVAAAVDASADLSKKIESLGRPLYAMLELQKLLDAILSQSQRRPLLSATLPPNKKGPARVASERPLSARAAPVPRLSSNGESLPSGEKRCLISAAQYENGITKQEMTILTGFKRSTRDAYILRLKNRGYVDEQGAKVLCTQEGLNALGSDYEPLPTGQELIDYWRGKLPMGEAKIFEVALAAYPQTVTRDSLDDSTGFKRSTRDAYILRMCSRRVIESVGRGEIRAAEEFFQ